MEQPRVFGPVPSRRLGKSIGINNIPPKICTYSCVYCQLGRSLNTEVSVKMRWGKSLHMVPRFHAGDMSLFDLFLFCLKFLFRQIGFDNGLKLVFFITGNNFLYGHFRFYFKNINIVVFQHMKRNLTNVGYK
jgi:hypothetical protein